MKKLADSLTNRISFRNAEIREPDFFIPQIRNIIQAAINSPFRTTEGCRITPHVDVIV
jgi:hypothetical protein